MSIVQILQLIPVVFSIIKEVRALLKEGADFAKMQELCMGFRDALQKSRETKDTSELENMLHLNVDSN
jgi:hypothetical protein